MLMLQGHHTDCVDSGKGTEWHPLSTHVGYSCSAHFHSQSPIEVEDESRGGPALSVGETLVHERGRLLFGIALGRAKELLGTPQPLGSWQLALNRALQKRAVDGALLAGPRTGKEYANFTLKKRPPTDQRRRTLAVENQPHSVDDFNGVIEEGYGKGEKRLIYSGTSVIKVGGSRQLGKINVHEHDAEKAGFHYDFVAEGRVLFR